MRKRQWTASAGLAALLAICSPVISAVGQTRYIAVPNSSSVKIDGASTMHDWEMEGKIIGGYIEFGSGIKLDATQTTLAGVTGDKVQAKCHALMPVTSIHSKAEHMPDVMDHLMQTHLKTDDFPRIEYTLTDMTFKGPHAAGAPFSFETAGNLSIAGVTNKVDFPITITLQDGGKIRVNATVPLKMTAYKIDPPAPNIGLGMMKCSDDVKIIIDWTLRERK